MAVSLAAEGRSYQREKGGVSERQNEKERDRKIKEREGGRWKEKRGRQELNITTLRKLPSSALPPHADV